MNTYLRFPNLAAARAHVAAQNTRAGLPRCDDAKWGRAGNVRGRLVDAPNPCPAEDQPVAGCAYVTWAVTEVEVLDDGTHVVQISRRHHSASDRGRARALTASEALGKRRVP